MVCGGVSGHEVEDQAHAARLRLGEETLGIVERAVTRSHAVEVADVVAGVAEGEGRWG